MKTLPKLALVSVLAISAAACTVIDPSSSSHSSSSSGGDSKSASLMTREQRIARFTDGQLRMVGLLSIVAGLVTYWLTIALGGS